MVEGAAAGLIRHLLVDQRGRIRWVKGACPPHPHPFLPGATSADLPFTELRFAYISSVQMENNTKLNS